MLFAVYAITRACLFGMGGASEVVHLSLSLVFVQFYLEHIASHSLHCRLRLEKLRLTTYRM